jgi:hypothetical protein
MNSRNRPFSQGIAEGGVHRGGIGLLNAPLTASFIFVFMRPTEPHVRVTEPETRLPCGIAPDFNVEIRHRRLRLEGGESRVAFGAVA